MSQLETSPSVREAEGVKNPLVAKVIKAVRNFVTQNATVTILAGVLVLVAITMPRFFNNYNVSTILGSPDLICIGLMALGATFVISTGEIDLSLAGVAIASSIVAALLAPYGAAVALLGAVGFGFAVGAVNGALVAWLRLPSFIVTLAMLMAMRGLSLIMAGRGRVPVDRDFGLVVFQNTKVGIVPMVFIVFAAISAICWFLYSKTRFGLHVLAVGGEQQASLMMGLRVPITKFKVFAISGALSGLAGAFLLAKTTTGNPLEGQGWELTAIAAVILGGTLLTGGKGSITGTVAGVALLTLVFQILNYVNGMGIEINTYMQNVIRGLFVLAVVILQARSALNAKNSRKHSLAVTK